MAKVTGFNKKNNKMGNSPIIVTVINEEMKQLEDMSYLSYTTFTVDGNIPVINGWKIVAQIDHIDGMNIINKLADVAIPEEFYTRKPFCDHCNTYRVKVNSILIQNIESGKFMHVGKTCLKDFFNMGIEEIINPMSFVLGLMDDINDGESFKGTGDHSRYAFSEVLMVSFCSIRQWGYRKSDTENSTKNSINSYYTTTGYQYFDISQEDVANTINAIEWLKVQGNSDFFTNLKTMEKMAYIPYKYFGYVAGLAGCYLKDQEKKTTEKLAFIDEYVGTIGKREVFNVSLIAKKAIESYYGVSYLHIFVDNAGHKMSWFASHDTDMEVNNSYNIKGTTKKHEEYQNVKQTMLSRVAVV